MFRRVSPSEIKEQRQENQEIALEAQTELYAKDISDHEEHSIDESYLFGIIVLGYILFAIGLGIRSSNLIGTGLILTFAVPLLVITEGLMFSGNLKRPKEQEIPKVPNTLPVAEMQCCKDTRAAGRYYCECGRAVN